VGPHYQMTEHHLPVIFSHCFKEAGLRDYNWLTNKERTEIKIFRINQGSYRYQYARPLVILTFHGDKIRISDKYGKNSVINLCEEDSLNELTNYIKTIPYLS